MEEVLVKNLSEMRDNGSIVSFEHNLTDLQLNLNINDSEDLKDAADMLCPINISYKLLFSKISIKNIVTLVNCLLLQKKVLLIN